MLCTGLYIHFIYTYLSGASIAGHENSQKSSQPPAEDFKHWEINIAFTPVFFIDRLHLLLHLIYYCVPIGCWDSQFQDKFSESHGKLVVSLAEPNTNYGNLGWSSIIKIKRSWLFRNIRPPSKPTCFPLLVLVLPHPVTEANSRFYTWN